MGKVYIQTETTTEPITLIGYEAGICQGHDEFNYEKCYKRGLECISSNHGRTFEFPQIYMTLSGYSARVIREIYTHIGGAPTRLQESTRYIDCSNFNYITPKSIENNNEALKKYEDLMDKIKTTYTELKELGIEKEDSALILPLAMESKIVIRTNLRMLIDMSRQRKCSRAYWEFRDFFKNLEESLSFYSDEWNFLVNDLKIFKSKCEDYGYCTEKKSCNRFPRKN